MDYTVYLIKCGVNTIMVASKVSKEDVIKELKERGFDNFAMFVKKSSRISYLNVRMDYISTSAY